MCFLAIPYAVLYVHDSGEVNKCCHMQMYLICNLIELNLSDANLELYISVELCARSAMLSNFGNKCKSWCGTLFLKANANSAFAMPLQCWELSRLDAGRWQVTIRAFGKSFVGNCCGKTQMVFLILLSFFFVF